MEGKTVVFRVTRGIFVTTKVGVVKQWLDGYGWVQTEDGELYWIGKSQIIDEVYPCCVKK